MPPARKGETMPGFAMTKGEDIASQRGSGAELLDLSLEAYKGNKGPNIRRTECYLKGRDKVKGRGRGQGGLKGDVAFDGKGRKEGGTSSGVFCFASDDVRKVLAPEGRGGDASLDDTREGSGAMKKTGELVSAPEETGLASEAR